IVDRYGADAHKFSLAYLAAQGQDILLDENDFAFGSRFANKIWNATRYILMNIEGRSLVARDGIEQKPIDRWIYHRLNDAARRVADAMAQYRFNDATTAVYEYFWNDFCDWYIEATKLSLYQDNEPERDRAVSLLLYVLEESLRLLHPFMSFLTEELYRTLPAESGVEVRTSDALIIASYPEYTAERDAPDVVADVTVLQELIRLVRTLRSEFTIPPGRKIPLHVRIDPGTTSDGFLEAHTDLIASLVGSQSLSIATETADLSGAVTLVGTGFEVYASVRDAIDVQKEVTKLTKTLEKTRTQLEASDRKLANEGFLSKAGDEIVAHEREKRTELADKVRKLEGYIGDLAE
ncbi:MAG: class I tRNA ligase family protein, partial [Spirochaetota bacterium]